MLLLVPGRILRSVVQTEVCAHVDYARSAGEPRPRLARADVVREAAEDDVDPVERRLGQEFPLQLEKRKDLLVRLTREGAGGQLCQFDAGMAGQQVHRGTSPISVAPPDPRPDLLWHECMRIRETA